MSDEHADRTPNGLADETSLYLRQHRFNPVDWQPWGAAALERAVRQDKPLLVSIGYSACHWCHVMERESFEDPDTAAVMNRHFVNLKVDREERPDVDRLYMDFVVRSSGHGGWPLTVFCTPEGKPFYGGTYFPPEPRHGMPSFRDVLESVARAWSERRGEVDASAHRVLNALGERARGVATATPGAGSLRDAATQLLAGADRNYGGFGGAPKFPTPTSLEALLAAVDELPGSSGRTALEHVRTTCREMSRRGLYDHLGGGFHRYCVDATWTIPHFEKMLYDQGLLLRVYAETWRRTGDDELIWPIRETAGYLRREMSGPEGGFFASQDADSEGEEGRYYVWTPEQVESALGAARAGDFCAAYGVTAGGNFEGGTTHLTDVARQPRERFAEERETLRRARSKRVAPATDPKRVASWNGYAASGLARAASALDDAALLTEAAATAEFVLDRMRDERGRLHHVFDGGRARVLGFLEDSAALLEACLDLYRAGAGDRFLARAAELADDLCDRFWDADAGEMFLTPSDGEPLVHRPRSEPDGATPHSAGQAALGLLRASSLCGRDAWARVVEGVLRGHAYLLERAPHAFPTLARAAALREHGVAVAVVVGDGDDPATAALAACARTRLAPEDGVVVVAPRGAPPDALDPSWLEGRTDVARPTAYLCRGTTCSLPVTDAAALEALPEPGEGATPVC